MAINVIHEDSTQSEGQPTSCRYRSRPIKLPLTALTRAVDNALEKLSTSISVEHLSQEQWDALHNIVQGNDTYVVLPTGSGKSLIFQLLPAVYRELKEIGQEHEHLKWSKDFYFPETPVVICVSPLLSLIHAHVKEMSEMGIRAAKINTNDESDLAIVEGEVDVILGTPEAWITSEKWRSVLRSDVFNRNVVCLVTDEVHCIPKWGLQSQGRREAVFRASFGRLAEMRTLLPQGLPSLALTATATISAQKKILKTLNMQRAVIIRISPDRVNIHLSVTKLPNVVKNERLDLDDQLNLAFMQTINLLKQNKLDTEKTIIYCVTVKECAMVYDFLARELGSEAYVPAKEKVPCNRMFAMYHHSTPDDIKERVLHELLLEDGIIRVVIATSALGMGVNISNIRRVIHFGVPRNIESYMQEIGRAGRDGKPSFCDLKYRSIHLLRADDLMKEYVRNNITCRRIMLLEHFAETRSSVKPQHACCDICQAKCACHTCLNSPPLNEELESSSLPEANASYRHVSDKDKIFLQKALQECKNWSASSNSYFLDPAQTCGLTDMLISDIMLHAPFIDSIDYIKSNISHCSHHNATLILNVFQELFHDIREEVEAIDFHGHNKDNRLTSAPFQVNDSESEAEDMF